MALTEEQIRRREELLRRKQERSEGNAPMMGFQKFDKKAIEIQERAAKAQQEAAEAQQKAAKSTMRNDMGNNPNEPEARGRGGSPILPTSIKLEKESNVDWEAFIWVTLAVLIWFIDRPDRLPNFIENIFGNLFGEPYSGFNFYVSNIISTDWVAILGSTLFMGFLVFNIFRQIVDRDVGILISIGALFVINTTARFAAGEGITLSTSTNYLLLALIIIAIVGFESLRRLKERAAGEIFYLSMALVYSYLYVNNGWIFSSITFFGVPKSVIHFTFITLFGFLYLRKKLDDSARWSLLTALFLVFDFFGYSLLSGS